MVDNSNVGDTFIPDLYKPSALLPIAQHERSILYAIEQHTVTIIVGQTGSGKSTQIPQYLDKAGWTTNGKVIAITQPRRVAATTVAARVAEEMKCQLGQDVGYSIRFEDVTSEKTRIKFLTDGLLLREALVDPLLSRYSVIMVDEAHERSLSSDMLLGILKKILKKRTDLKIIISSATIQAEAFLNFFALVDISITDDSGSNKVTGTILSIEGRSFPVDIQYLESPTDNYIERGVQTVFDIHTNEPPGDILVFLSGRDEIEKFIDMLAERIPALPKDKAALYPLPLYAGLSTAQQMYIFEPTPENTVKVIVVTNIAEASLTIPNIVYVIDSGFVKLRSYDPKTSIESLFTVPISQASALQRSGRAGRVKPGKCYRLYTSTAYSLLSATTSAEIQRSNLTPVILQLKALGIENIARFPYLTPPSSELIIRALESLYVLGALDEYARLTKPLGVRMAEMGVQPELAKCILSAVDMGCVHELLSIAAMTIVNADGNLWVMHQQDDDDETYGGRKGRKGWETSRWKFAVEEGDQLTLLNVYLAFTGKEGRRDQGWCRNNMLNYKSLTKAVSIRNQLYRYLERFGIKIDDDSRRNSEMQKSDKAENIRKCLAMGYFANAARMQTDGSFRTVDGNITMFAHPSSLMFYLPKIFENRIERQIGLYFMKYSKQVIKSLYETLQKLKSHG